MLTPEELKAIQIEIGKNESPRAACVDALRAVQARRGWVPDAAIAELAPLLGMTADELDAVATFYSLIFRRPVGRHVILLCDSVSCWVMGQESALGHITRRLGIAPGETTPDGQFTLLPVSCIGACDEAPAMLVDGVLYGHLTPETIDAILSRCAGE